MKVLVFSDSHGTITYMQQAIRSEEPDVVLHLGDVMRDARVLQREYPQLRLEQVCGNCDGADAQPEELELTLQGHKIMMTHGHPYHVKLGSAWVVRTAQERGAEVLLFGHTHIPLVDRVGSLWVMNPGTIQGLGQTTYGVMTLEQDKIDCRIVSLR